MKLRIQISDTAVGESTYVQVISEDTLTVNACFVVEEVELRDDRSIANRARASRPPRRTSRGSKPKS